MSNRSRGNSRPSAAQRKSSAVSAAVGLARDVTDGVVGADDLERQALEECRALFGTVAGAGDPLWELHVEVARQVLALGGVPAVELAEWAAVQRQAEGAEPVVQESWIESTLERLADDDPDQDQPTPRA